MVERRRWLVRQGARQRPAAPDPQSLANLQASAERAKRTLSKLMQVNLTCTHAGKVLSLTSLTRSRTESLTRDLPACTRVRRCNSLHCIAQARFSWEQIDRVLLVGGSTHMPMTRALLRELSRPGSLDNSLAVSEMVARGAHTLARRHRAPRSRSRRGGPRNRPRSGSTCWARWSRSTSTLTRWSGYRGQAGHRAASTTSLIPRNTQLPTAASRVYRTVAENQPRVRVKVLQGDAPQADACIPIGECWVEGLPPELPKHSPVQVRCGVGSNGLIDVLALDMTSGKIARTTLRRSHGLTDEENAREAAWVQSLRIQ